MKPFLALLKRELASVARERTILIALLIQLFIASFSSALLLGLLSLYDPDAVMVNARVNLRVGVIGELTRELVPFLTGRGLKVVAFNTLAESQAAYKAGQVDAVIVAPNTAEQIVNFELYVPRAEARSSLIQLILQEPLKQYENVLRTRNGLTVRYSDLKGTPPTTFEFLYSIILPMLMFFPAFVAGNLVADSLSEEFELNTMDTLLTTPLSWHSIVGAKIAAAVILSILQCALWLGLLALNRTEMYNVPWVLAMGGILAAMLGAMAAFVAVVFRNREQAQFVYALLLMGGLGLSYLFGISPLTTISRLAIGDAYTDARNVLFFGAVLAVMFVALYMALRQRATR